MSQYIKELRDKLFGHDTGYKKTEQNRAKTIVKPKRPHKGPKEKGKEQVNAES